MTTIFCGDRLAAGKVLEPVRIENDLEFKAVLRLREQLVSGLARLEPATIHDPYVPLLCPARTEVQQIIRDLDGTIARYEDQRWERTVS